MSEQSVIVTSTSSPKLLSPLSASHLSSDSDNLTFFSEVTAQLGNKERTGAGAVKKTRNWYQCRRCRYHGQFVFLAGGHYQVCPFRNCTCQACRYVSKDTERAGQRMREWRKTKKGPSQHQHQSLNAHFAERTFPARAGQVRIPAPGHPSNPSPGATTQTYPEANRFPVLTHNTAFSALLPNQSNHPLVLERQYLVQALGAQAPTPPSTIPTIRPLPPLLAIPTVVRPNSPNSAPSPFINLAETQRLREIRVVHDINNTNIRRAGLKRPSTDLSPHSASSSPATNLKDLLDAPPMKYPKLEATTPPAVPRDRSYSDPIDIERQDTPPPKLSNDTTRSNNSGSRSPECRALLMREVAGPGPFSLSEAECLMSLLDLARELSCTFTMRPDGEVTLGSEKAEKALKLVDLGSAIRVTVEAAGKHSANSWPKAGGGWEQFLLFLRTLIVTLVNLSQSD